VQVQDISRTKFDKTIELAVRDVGESRVRTADFPEIRPVPEWRNPNGSAAFRT
jgi:hypothetical protein